jgi:hypothetical protein
MDLARLKVGDEVNVTIHESGSIVLTQVRPMIGPKTAAAAAKRLIIFCWISPEVGSFIRIFSRLTQDRFKGCVLFGALVCELAKPSRLES